MAKARDFLQCVLVEIGAATKELRASNYELEQLLEEVLSTRADLRELSVEDGESVDSTAQEEQAPPEHRVAELKRKVEDLREQGAAAIAQSMRLRRRSQRIRTALEGGRAKPAQAAGQRLSKREREVLSLMVAGRSSKEIAAALGISFKTAVTHRASIMSKLDVHEIASVVREAIRRGLV